MTYTKKIKYCIKKIVSNILKNLLLKGNLKVMFVAYAFINYEKYDK